MAAGELSNDPIARVELRDWLSRAGWPSREASASQTTTGSLPILSPDLLEASRLLRANLSPGDTNSAPPPLLILGTTSDPRCASLATGVALALAEEGKSTLLVDADLRQPVLHRLFSLDPRPGLADALEPAAALPLPVPVGHNLWVLPAGRSRRSPAELLRASSAADVTRFLAEAFDAVVYHASGQVSYPDALLLAAHVRAAVLVIRTGSDSAEQVGRVKEQLQRAGVEILGFAVVDKSQAARAPKLAPRAPAPEQQAAGGSRWAWGPIAPRWLALAAVLLLIPAALLVPLEAPQMPALFRELTTAGVQAVPPTTQSDPVQTARSVSAAAPAAATRSLKSVIDERFSGANTRGWPDDDGGTAWLVGGEYRLLARDPGRFVSVGAPGADQVRDVVVSARFHKVGGPPGGGYGLLVRDQGPGPRDGWNTGGRYYVAAASDIGEVGIWRRENDKWIDLVPWTPSGAVRTGSAANELTLEAIGSRLTFLVNGLEVAVVDEATLPAGGFGIFAGGDLNEVEVERLTVQVPT